MPMRKANDADQVQNEADNPPPASATTVEDRALGRLRQKFVVWGVAIASSLTTTGVVTLQPSAAWAQEEAATAQKDDVAQALNETAYEKLIADKEFAQAGEMLDAAMAAEPENTRFLRLDLTLAGNLLRTDKPAAIARLENLKDKLLSSTKLDNTSVSLLPTIAMYLTNMADGSFDEKLALLNQMSEKLASSDSRVATATQDSLLSTKVRLLTMNDKLDDAKALMDELITSSRAAIDTEKSSTIANFVSKVSMFESMIGSEFTEAADKLRDEAKALALGLLNRDDADAASFTPYYSLMYGQASRLLYTDPKQATKVLEEVKEKLDALTERLSEDEAKSLVRSSRDIAGLASRVESALLREALIGTKAPEFDAAHFVAMDAVTMDDLKGKVVLLDFWAVWCGPCIATFPHLIDWHEKYADKGLVIVGVTKFYNFTWDEEAGSASSQKEEVPAEAELAMLEKFRELYKLHHGFVVTPKDSEYSKAFHVTGIPQAVLLDKEGKVRMIRVGSGEANAKALEAEIEALLGN